MSAEAAVASERPPLLRLEGINTYYGQMHILQVVSLEVGEGELVLGLRRLVPLLTRAGTAARP